MIGRLFCWIRRKLGGRHRYVKNAYGLPVCGCGRVKEMRKAK